MDKTTLIGLVMGIAAVLGGAMLDGTSIQSLVNLPAFLIVIGGTTGATALSYPLEQMLNLPRLFRQALFDKSESPGALVETFVRFATMARKEGVLSLEKDAEQIPDPFLRKGIQLAVDGTDETVIRQVLTADIEAMSERHQIGYSLFETMGGFAPTLGIMGAVLGLIHVLSQVADPSKLAAGIAVAFVATLYGVGSANLIFFPVGNKLRMKSEEEMRMRHLIVQGVLAIQAGENPRILRDRLEVFLSPSARGKAAQAQSSQVAAAEPAAATGTGG